jgi:hypothetical protein
MNPFEYVNAISDNKKDLMVDDITEKAYNAFTINRSLSYFNDTILAANEMNILHHLDKKLQYHFLLGIVRKRKRFSKWNKAETVADIDVVKEYYKYSNEKARQVLSLLTTTQIESLKEMVYKGGNNGKPK